MLKVTAAGAHVNLTASELARSTQRSPSSASQALLSSLKVQGVWYRPEVAISLILFTGAFKRRGRHSAPYFLSYFNSGSKSCIMKSDTCKVGQSLFSEWFWKAGAAKESSIFNKALWKTFVVFSCLFVFCFVFFPLAKPSRISFSMHFSMA